MFSSIRQHYQIMKDHSNVTKMHFWMIQRAKKEVFGHFRDFGLLDRLDIADCDGTKSFSGFGNLTRSWMIIQKSLKCIFEWSKAPKKRFSWFMQKWAKNRFLTIFLGLVGWITFIMHILIVIYDFDDMARRSFMLSRINNAYLA